MLSDLHFALRRLRLAPGFAALAVARLDPMRALRTE